MTKCLDGPEEILRAEFCVNPLSKDLRGYIDLLERDEHRCTRPECRTLKTAHRFKVAARSHLCDSAVGQLLDGTLIIERLASAFDRNGEQRGFHGGDFQWITGDGTKVVGRMSGITNAGTHRAPAFQGCQRCHQPGVLEGRMCGEVVETRHDELQGCWVQAAYRVTFDPGAGGGDGAVFGTLEGVVICPCQR